MLKTLIFSFSFYMAMCLLPTGQAYAASSIGRVVHAYGPAWIERGSNRSKAEKGALVFRNDTIITGARARVKVVMADGSKVYIGTQSRISLRKYAMKDKKLISATIHMLWGKARFFVNKLVTKNASYRVHTPTAVLGVRGTEFLVSVPPTPELLKRAFEHLTLADIPLLPTRTVLMEGSVNVSTSTGHAVLLTPGNTADVNTAKEVKTHQTRSNDIDSHKSAMPSQKDAPKTPSQKKQKGKTNKNKPFNKSSLPNDDIDTDSNKFVFSPPPSVPSQKTTPANKTQAQQGANKYKGGNKPQKPSFDATPATNAIQNLGSTTDVTIQAGFVKP